MDLDCLDSDRKLIVSWLVGGRDGEYALAFMDDVKDRLANRVQLTTDVHMVALYTVWYNFIRVHKTLKMSPAMAAGVSQTLWLMDDFCGMMDAVAPETGKRGPYKKATA